MPRELVRPVESQGGIPVAEWVDTWYHPDNYAAARTATFELVERMSNEYLRYRLVGISEEFEGAMLDACDHSVARTACLLEVPLVCDEAATVVKQACDALYFNGGKSGIAMAWDVSLDADYSRIHCCVFDASSQLLAGQQQRALDNIDAALSVLKVHRHFHDRQPELQRLTRICHEMPVMRDCMHKYTSALVGGQAFDARQLELLFNTVVRRNLRHTGGRGDARRILGMCVLMPLINLHFDPEVDASAAASVVCMAFQRTVASLPLDDFHMAAAQMGRLFGSVARGQVGRSARQLRAGNALQAAPAVDANIDWVHAGNACAMVKRVGGSSSSPSSSAGGASSSGSSSSFSGGGGGEHVRAAPLAFERNLKLSVGLAHGHALLVQLLLLPGSARAKVLYGSDNCYVFEPERDACVRVSLVDGRLLALQFPDGDVVELPGRRDSFVLQTRCCIVDLQQVAAADAGAQLAAGGAFNTMCSICLEDVAAGQLRSTTACRHAFHTACLHSWRNHCARSSQHASCPLCRC